MQFKNLLKNLPEVRGPVEKKLSFNVKLKWTLIVLAAFFVLANIPLFGLANNVLERFEYIAIILGTDFGSVISLGIGPIVMASIILQLLVGSKIVDIDTSTDEGKKYFQGLQKLMVFFFVIFEAMVYVLMKGLQAAPGFTGLVIFQLCLGGLAIVFMDELVQKWGFGSGVSLFILAGVGWRLFTGLFQFLQKNCTEITGRLVCQTSLTWPFTSESPIGKILVLVWSLINQNPVGAFAAGAVLVVTVIIFIAVVWAQSLKVEVPLSFDRLRGYSMKWPLAFFYAGVIPVILTAALAANLQLAGGLVENVAMPCIDNDPITMCGGAAKIASYFTFLGRFSQGQPIAGLAFWISPVNLVENAIRGSLQSIFIPRAIVHVLFYVVFSTIFAVFWIKTSGMDAGSQARNIMNSGLQIPGFRKDERVLESVLSRYVMPLTIMGGAAIGLLAAGANLLGALTSGTAILLAVMITYQFYQNIAQQHAVDMHPAMRKFMG